MSVSENDILNTAKLARIDINAEQIPDVTQGINDVLKLIDQMQNANTSNIKPLAHPHDATQRLREDVVTATDERKKLMSNAPECEKDHFLVPKVID